jgi:hypothetical protein
MVKSHLLLCILHLVSILNATSLGKEDSDSTKVGGPHSFDSNSCGDNDIEFAGEEDYDDDVMVLSDYEGNHTVIKGLNLLTAAALLRSPGAVDAGRFLKHELDRPSDPSEEPRVIDLTLIEELAVPGLLEAAIASIEVDNTLMDEEDSDSAPVFHDDEVTPLPKIQCHPPVSSKSSPSSSACDESFGRNSQSVPPVILVESAKLETHEKGHPVRRHRHGREKKERRSKNMAIVVRRVKMGHGVVEYGLLLPRESVFLIILGIQFIIILVLLVTRS